MFPKIDRRLREGAAQRLHVSEHPSSTSDVSALRPIRAQLGAQDYWQLNAHRRRFEAMGTERFLRLARLIRAKLRDAMLFDSRDIVPDVVMGTSRVVFVIDTGRPQARRLYRWAYPEGDCSRLAVGTFLGATLIGMRVGQRTCLFDSDDVLRSVQVVAVDGLDQPGPAFGS